jgi:hypothetical protein
LTTDDRVTAIAEFGFSERQARFLEMVLRHAGVCVPRQYASFAGIANGGDKCNAFFDKLIKREYAVACYCVHNRARLYRVPYKPLYRAIGEIESRYRRPLPAGRGVERVMLLDAVLGSPNLNWLTSEAERVAYLAALNGKASAVHTMNARATTPSPRRVAASSSPFPIGTMQPAERFCYTWSQCLGPRSSEPSFERVRRSSATCRAGRCDSCFPGLWTARTIRTSRLSTRNSTRSHMATPRLKRPRHPVSARRSPAARATSNASCFLTRTAISHPWPGPYVRHRRGLRRGNRQANGCRHALNPFLHPLHPLR